MSAIKQTVTALEAALAELADRAQRQAAALERVTARAEQLEARLASGTADHAADLLTAEWSPIPTKPDLAPAPVEPPRRARRTSAPAPVAAPAPPRDVAKELETALRTKPASLTELARVLRVPVNHIVIALRGLRKAGRVYNLGTSEAPRWMWIIGDDAPAPELQVAVEALLRDRPMTFRELTAATGARRTRLSGAIVWLQRHGAAIENRGDPRRARWFLAK